MTDKSQAALSNLRVLDLTQVLSGPFCTQMLSDMGAEVIKLEGPQGDVSREMPPFRPGEDSVYYLSINRNKQSIVVDMKTEQGLDLVRKLALTSDVVVENFRPGVCERLGLSATALRAQKPSLIWCSISGFGQTGPYRDKPAYDIIVQALSGGMSLTGARDGVSVRAGIPIADLTAGMYAAFAIVSALHRRERTGQGDVIDISMLDCQAAMLCYQAAFYLNSGVVPGHQGREHDGIATYGTFAAADGIEVVIAAVTERMWATLCEILGCPELIKDARFVTAEDRKINRAALIPILQQRFLLESAEEWMKRCDRKGVPAGIVNKLDRVMADPQITHRGMIVELAGKDDQHARVIGDPIFFQEAKRPTLQYPPASGEHTVTVLKDVLGLEESEIQGLIASGAVRARR
ncbi:MAG: CoA transferase [Pseudolabrys sp.]|nr:CoA transferase [Pseudolabrys sp.]MDP2293874.1 CoA transferase [Pseudolabrys sp.]